MSHISTEQSQDYTAADARVAEIIEKGKRPGGRFSGARESRFASPEQRAEAAMRNRNQHVVLGDEEEKTLAAMRDEDEKVEESKESAVAPSVPSQEEL